MENIVKFECVECCEVIEISSIENSDLKEELIKNKICVDCFNNDYFVCEDCGEIESIEYKTTVQDGYNSFMNVCDECISYNNHIYIYCEECDTWYHTNYNDYEMVNINGYDTCICEECVNDNENIFYCEFHNQYEKNDNMVHVENVGLICYDGVSDGYYDYCDDCDCYYDIDCMTYIEDEETYYCDECAKDHQGVIKSYHGNKDTHANNKKVKCDAPNNMTFGFELEVERGSEADLSNKEAAKGLYDIMDNFVVFENDSSIDDGFEIISRPFDIGYYEEEGKQLIDNMLNDLKYNNYLSHDPGTCGLHFHVGRAGLGDTYAEIDKTIKNISIILEYFKEELTTLSRRKASDLRRWSKFLTGNYDKDELKAEYITDLMKNNNDRYSALNLRNSATIEFRFFRGTLKNESFHAAFELIYNIVSYSKDHDLITDLSILDINNIFTYKLNNYIGEYMQNKLCLVVA